MESKKIMRLATYIARMYAISVSNMQSDCRTADVVEARALLTAASEHIGIRHYVLGFFLRKHKASITYYSNKAKDLLSCDYNFMRIHQNTINYINDAIQK